ncbi:TIGR02302 family protein [Celeribacter sp.]|uniref:TIGR02302 family protein n=1 Tax=Celeribacter sp. TaxID=1890673 RepID=UPI003A908F1E
MHLNTDLPDWLHRRLRTTLGVTRWGMIYERAAQAFWPFFSIVFAASGLILLGVHERLGDWVLLAVSVAVGVAALASLILGVRAFVLPREAEVVARVDARLKGRPLQALSDTQATGQGAEASDALWAAHMERMAARVADAAPVPPDPELSPRDPYGLRLVALCILGMGVLFGSVERAQTVVRGSTGDEIAMGAIWEGWITPPRHTGKPTLYMADLDDRFDAPKGSEVTLRLYGVGEDGPALEIRETVSGDETSAATDFAVQQAGQIEIDGPSGRLYNVALVPDERPTAELVGEMTRAASGETRQDFRLTDDFGVVRAVMTIERDLDAVVRRYGFVVDPELRAPLEVNVVLPRTGDRTEIEGVFAENFSLHPFSGLPVMLSLTAYDATGQASNEALGEAILPGRRFFDPLAAALIDVRRELLWNRANATRNAQVLRAVSYQPEEVIDDPALIRRLRAVIAKLESRPEPMPDALVDEIATELWDLAVELEDGELKEALERLRRAQERLQQAMRDGASQEEIAKLMDELREATRDYLQQLAEQQGEDGEGADQPDNGETIEMTGDQLQEMMDRIQELMEQGRMAEAQQLMDLLNQMLENMQVSQSQDGQGGDGGPAMQGMQDMLRDQQELNDDTFSDLQNQFNEEFGGEQGQQQDGEQQNGQQQDGQQQGNANEQGDGQLDRGDLADRQEALRRELQRQRGSIPSGPNGEAIGEALDEADRAMDDAEQALREGDLSGALDSQAEAMESLREGMRQLGEQMAQNGEQDGDAQQGRAGGLNSGSERRDPLGRSPGDTGQFGTDDEFAQGEDVYRRAEELLEEIRRRSAEQSRPEEERDYLERLLDRF